jgi:uncharacterized damage-inducible protein DinB
MTTVLLELVHHKTWATRKLFGLLESLDPAVIDSSAPGTYGTIRKTLVHMVNADRSYYRRLCGEQPWPRMDEDSTSLPELMSRFEEIVQGWEALALDDSLADRDLHYPRGEVIKGAVTFGQSIHHGDVHRAHVLSILGAQGISVPEFDFWEFASEVGLATEPTTS